ncbi:metallopeptidase family protein [Tuwongella immobilis]|uniref:Metallopeptidase family protein n=1 Tax=Tuwongella immobilis TaxID=692036 RepID=A0A6C2YT40_9BACT|nr:metallopeptidase family protein [Tuwongella immobilis]VIP04551.1 Uncharacterized conserved protein OS=Kytococcus sedentarius (strain ATCC 14392 / DSM 20547 / CCM 314 / 541) GN=Ksed_16220 PE=4 SV=1: DUF1025 [Tuwongella immobilis]VTS06463.1 Uncharacterized conserved protein OS=Kytococcus sedentarius (strain ATCC 14392 / DSM 20547 / CCM 314 / 541) GN=Ksed_16220 PE=4 SV=1: DUF1025 [Tuwongella immobilis]
MARLSMREFARIVRRVIDRLPPELHEQMENVVVDVAKAPSRKLLRESGLTDAEIDAGDSVYGLFIPMPMPLTDGFDFFDQPHRILIFRDPLQEDFPDPQQLRIEIRKTVLHELAHHFGWEDSDLQRFDDHPNPFADDLDDADDPPDSAAPRDPRFPE